MWLRLKDAFSNLTSCLDSTALENLTTPALDILSIDSVEQDSPNLAKLRLVDYNS